MQTDRNDMKVEKSVGTHWHAFEPPCKRLIVTDTKSCNASHIILKVESIIEKAIVGNNTFFAVATFCKIISFAYINSLVTQHL